MSFAKTVFCLALTSFAFFQISWSRLLNEPGIHNAVYLGTVEGKSFFAEKTPTRNWTEARESCNASGMALASITSKPQYDLIKLKGSSSNLYGYYWTSGRDAPTMSRYVWDTTQEAPNATILNLPYPPVVKTCLVLLIQGPDGSVSHFYGDPCEVSFGTLCEIVHGDKY